MSYSVDANILLYAADASAPLHKVARRFLDARHEDPDLFCITWLTLMAFLRIATHPAVFSEPLSPADAWNNVCALLALPRVRIIGETPDFANAYRRVASRFPIRGNLVPDAHLATVLQEHGINRIYTHDTDFRKFAFIESIDPLASGG